MFLISAISLSTDSIVLELREGDDLWQVMKQIYQEIISLSHSVFPDDRKRKKFIDRVEQVGEANRRFYSEKENSCKQNWDVYEKNGEEIKRTAHISAYPIFLSQTLDCLWCIQEIEMNRGSILML